jgi:hypothetical protein
MNFFLNKSYWVIKNREFYADFKNERKVKIFKNKTKNELSQTFAFDNSVLLYFFRGLGGILSIKFAYIFNYRLKTNQMYNS